MRRLKERRTMLEGAIHMKHRSSKIDNEKIWHFGFYDKFQSMHRIHAIMLCSMITPEVLQVWKNFKAVYCLICPRSGNVQFG